METFASGPKRNYYGKGDVIVYRLHRDGKPLDAGCGPVFGANVKLLVYGDAFWNTYATGDNTGLIATDSMKNFIQRETMNWSGCDLEGLCQFLGEKFLAKYPHTEGAQISATELPYGAVSQARTAFAPGGPECMTTRIEMTHQGTIEAISGIRGFRLLRLGGSAFHGFIRDEYTTLPDIKNRPLHMWLDLEWTYAEPSAAFTKGGIAKTIREMTLSVFESMESGSIQQVIYRLGKKILAEVPAVAEIHLEANNRTWDTIAEQGDELGVYTDSRPPYGCLGLRLRRD